MELVPAKNSKLLVAPASMVTVDDICRLLFSLEKNEKNLLHSIISLGPPNIP